MLMALDFKFLNSSKARIILITVEVAEQLGKQAHMQLQACFLGLIVLTLRLVLRTFHDSPLMWGM